MSRPLHALSFPNPYPTSPPPYNMPHKVWILDCKNCNMFLTNRGMKVTHSIYNLSIYAQNVFLGSPTPATQRLPLFFRHTPRKLLALQL